MWALIQNWRISVWVIGIPVLIGIIAHFFVYALIRKFTQKSHNKIDDSLAKHLYRPLQWLLVVFTIYLGLGVALPKDADVPNIKQLLSLISIALIAWAAIRTVQVLEDYVSNRFDVSVKDNLRARKIQTQFRVLRRIVIVIIIVIAVSTMLMTFDKVKQLGATILASAGIFGIVLGFAAQKTLGNFIAGLQIAFSHGNRSERSFQDCN